MASKEEGTRKGAAGGLFQEADKRSEVTKCGRLPAARFLTDYTRTQHHRSLQK